MNCLLTMLALMSSSTMTSTIMDVPECTLYDRVFLDLFPGSLMRLGRTCRMFKELAFSALLTRFTKIKDGGRRFDIELLYDIYHEIEEQNEPGEKLALQRLIERNYPDVNGGILLQSKYETFKSYLFDPEYAPNILQAYQEFPEVTRMLLKHKRTVSGLLEPSPLLLDPPFAELAIKRMATVEEDRFFTLFRQADPKALKQLFKLLAEPPYTIKNILATRDPAFLLEHPDTITIYDVALVCSMADELDGNLVSKIIDSVRENKELVTALPNWIFHQQMKSVCIKLFEIVHSQNVNPSLFALLLAKPGVTAPFEFYRALRGSETVDAILDYLRSYDEDRHVFTGVVPEDVSGSLIFETALILDRSDSMLYSIMKLEGFRHCITLAFLSTLKERSTEVIINLLKTQMDGVQIFSAMSLLKLDMEPEVFSYLLHHYVADTFHCFLMLWCGEHNAERRVQNWKTFLDYGLHSDHNLPLIIKADFLFESERSGELITMLVEYTYKHRLTCYWDVREYISGNFKGAMAFFDSRSVDELLDYIPATITYEPGSWRSFDNIVDRSYFLAVRCVLARKGGYEALRNHFQSHEDFSVLMLFAGHPEVDYMACLSHLMDRSHLFVVLMRVDPEFAPNAQRLLEYLSNSADDARAMKFLVEFYIRCTEDNLPFRDLFPLHHLADKHFDAFLNMNQDGLACLKHDYYGPRLAAFYSDKNMISKLISILVKHHGVTSYANINQNWPYLIPYLNQDQSITDAIISKINAEAI